MSSHTPGPWVWDCKNHDNRERPFIRCTKNYFGAEKGASICKVSTVLPRSECEANARLIAAAPELLAACKMMDKWLERDLCDDPELEQLTLQTVYGSVREAIAKAEGVSK